MRRPSFLFLWLTLSTACGGGGPNPPGSGGSPAVGGSPATGGQSANGGTETGGTGTGGAGGTPAVGGSGGTSTGGDASGGGPAGMEWLPSWATTMQLTEPDNNPPPPGLANNTLRQFLWPTVSGSQIRVQLSNERGDVPVDIARVHIAKAKTGSNPNDSQGQIDATTDAAFTFGGEPSVTIPVGATVWSDPLDFALEDITLTAISMHFGATVPEDVTGHPGARTLSYVASGDAVAEEALSNAATKERWYFINAIEVMAPADAFAIALLGDSITDGYGTLNDFSRWTDFLTLALKEDPALASKRSVLNFGMGGNCLTSSSQYQDSGLDRFARDVLGRDKIRWLVVLEGVNDITSGVQAGTITGAYQSIIDAGEAAGIEVFVSPLTPMNAQNSPVRGTMNDWIRASQNYDAGIDFDLAIRDPGSPTNMLAPFKNDDLHPSILGYQAMGESIDLTLFYP
jgi:lysophospholipase L1-like esterase